MQDFGAKHCDEIMINWIVWRVLGAHQFKDMGFSGNATVAVQVYRTGNHSAFGPSLSNSQRLPTARRVLRSKNTDGTMAEI